MITPAEIKAKALRYWQNQRCLRAWLAGDKFFPLVIPFAKPNAQQLLTEFEDVRRWLQLLRRESKEQRGYGYSIVFKEAKHRQLGEQALPARISFDTPDDFYKYIGKQREFERLQALAAQIEAAQPGLRPWIAAQPLQVLEYADVWPRLLQVMRFLQACPMLNRYVRELDIPGVDSKFIEQHKTILRELLDCVLPPLAINAEVSSIAGNGFERRYGLKHEEPSIRFRLLDEKLVKPWGLSDLTVPLSEFHRLALPCQRVFITENKINGLSFPPTPDGMVIFGLGYGVGTLKQTPWLHGKSLYYWGDIDTHGFAMLSQVRSYFPQAASFLMDRETLFAHQSLWGQEEHNKRCDGALTNLTDAEQELYTLLKTNGFGQCIRLEQERIGFAYLVSKLEDVTENRSRLHSLDNVKSKC